MQVKSIAGEHSAILLTFIKLALSLRSLFFLILSGHFTQVLLVAQWLSGRVLDSRPRGRGFKPHRRPCVVVLEQDTFILA